jgi:trk system potassium uptake protein TrkH
MFDMRPVGYVHVLALGLTMLLPLGADLVAGNGHWGAFAEAAAITMLIGLFLTLSCANAVLGPVDPADVFPDHGLAVLPIFGALPFVFGAMTPEGEGARYVDAFFEAMSGLTTTGATAFEGLDALPVGINLWRGLLQWFGGIGIIVVAMVFLPELRVGGMQIFRSEGFDTMGKILPRATEIAARISVIYLGLTIVCGLTYTALGMPGFDALMHALTTISTGGFSNHDESFGVYKGPLEYVAVVFMILASLPFVRYIQLVAGTAKPLYRDSQVRAYLATIAIIVLALALYRVLTQDAGAELSLREALFNVTSIISGTGYSSTDYQLWGGVAVVTFFFAG